MSARSGPCAKSIVTKCSTENVNAICELNVAELESILRNPEIKDMKVVLISIAGAFRKGKSFLLNLFVSYLEWLTNGKQGEWLHADTPMDKFEYRAGTAAHTNGITIWNKPYLLNGLNGEKVGTFDVGYNDYKIRESFEKHLKQFIPHLFISENLVVKKINGHAITCEELCELFKKYMEIFNNGQLPEPKAIFEATAETVNNLAEQAAKDAYDVMMAEAMDVNPDLCDIPILDDSQKFAMEVARERFEARPKMGEFSVQIHLENLEKYFDHHYEMFKKTVLQNINSFIQSVNYNEERQEMLDTLEAQLRRQADLEQSETNKQLILEGLKAITTLGMVALSLRAGAIP